jgi:DNA polymerase-2
MSQFIYQIEKKETEESVILKYYSVDAQKNTNIEETELNYVLYIKKDDFELINIKSDSIVLTTNEFFNKNKEKVVEIKFLNKEIYTYFKEKLRDSKIHTFEEDLPYEHLDLISEKKVIYDGKDSSKVSLKTLSIDIETIGEVEHQEIVLLSTHSFDSNSMNLVYISKSALPKDKLESVLKHKFKEFKAIFVEDEKELLEKFKEDTIAFEPQLIIGWNVIDFDFKVIKERMKAYSIEFNLSKHPGPTKMRVAKDFFGKSNLSYPGLLVFDIIQILKTNFISFDDYKLNTVAKAVLKDEKIDLEDEGDADLGIKNKIHAIENMLNKDPINLIEYNYKDSLLTSKICEKLNLIDLMIQRSITTNTPILKVQSPIATLDIMYLQQLHKRGFIAPSNFNFSEMGAIEGAFVLDPKAGFYKDVFVLDFKSLYPSIMVTFNIDPYSIEEHGEIEAPNGATFNSEEGIMSSLISMLLKERDLAKKNKDMIKSHALKITMNSFYGAMASPKSRFHNRDIGEAITSFGRELMQETIKFVESKGLNSVYCDTDSTFVCSNKEFKTVDEKTEFGSKLESEINVFVKQYVAKKTNRSSKLIIEFEKLYSQFFIASKKRYVGFDEFTKKTSYTGMEAIRGDWTRLAQEFQKKLVEMIFKNSTKDEIKQFIVDEVKKLESGEYDSDLVYTKRITKPLIEYTKTTPPHVKAARELKEFSGKIVKYVMLENKPTHISMLGRIKEERGEVPYDYKHYIEKQLNGVSDDLLEHIDIDFEEVIGAKKQKSLSQFF